MYKWFVSLIESEKGVLKPAKIDGESNSSTSGESSDLSLSSEDFDELLISKALLRSASYCIDEKSTLHYGFRKANLNSLVLFSA